MMRRRAAVAGVALAVDLLAGELPNQAHPVAWLGRGIRRGESMAGESRGASQVFAGFALLTAAAGVAAVTGAMGSRLARRLPWLAGAILEAVLLKQAFALRALVEHAHAVAEPLERDDLSGARTMAARMVSRDTSALEPGLVASAAIESVGENLSDSVVAPLAWQFAFGLAGAYVYRAVNTLDATIGYRERGWLGTPSARADDLLNLVPARLTAGLIVVASGRRPVRAWQGAVRDHSRTPSPNSGWPMAAMAHGLGRRLEKPAHHLLNEGAPLPNAADIRRACRVALASLGLGAALVAATLSAGRPR